MRLIDRNVARAVQATTWTAFARDTSAGRGRHQFFNFAKPTQVLRSPIDQVPSSSAPPTRCSDARAKGGEVTIQGDFPTIEGDDVMMRQAFSNLVRNAIEAVATVPRSEDSDRWPRRGSNLRCRSMTTAREFRLCTRARVSSLLYDQGAAPVWAWRSCRKSSSRTTAACMRRPRRQAARDQVVLPVAKGVEIPGWYSRTIS